MNLLSNGLKRILDIIGSFALVFLLAPLYLVIALIVKATSPGPVFFVQERLGKEGRIFRMIKFRSMVSNAEKTGTGLFSYSGDPRITHVGATLRRTSLDEIPQFFNVLVGSMSLVGPRPAVTYELGDFATLPPHILARFAVKPGITGLAQVCGRNDLSWDEKIKYDTRYIALYRKWGPLVDVAILLKTVVIVLSMSKTIEGKG